MEALVVVGCSRSSLKQRAGRAGRVQPGKVFRLFPMTAEEQLPHHAIPEIQRCNLTQVVMQLKALGIDDILHFDFLSPPPTQNIANALEVRYQAHCNFDPKSALLMKT
jgi:ATP-dependent RNA helicase DDX35